MDCSLPFPFPRDLPGLWIQTGSAPLQADALLSEPPGKPLDCVGHNKLWKILKEIRILDYCTCFQGRLEAGQDTAVGIAQGTMNWYKIGKEMQCYAKSLQSCPTLCDPIDGSPPGFLIPEILQARTLEWVAIASGHWDTGKGDLSILLSWSRGTEFH